VKTVVLERTAERVVFHPRLLDFALLAGFTPRACRPYPAQSKGRVERASLLRLKPTSTFASLLVEERQVVREPFLRLEGNRYAAPWRYAGRHVVLSATAAHVRMHGTTDRSTPAGRITAMVPPPSPTAPGQP
jgi:hypothetical protein